VREVEHRCPAKRLDLSAAFVCGLNSMPSAFRRDTVGGSRAALATVPMLVCSLASPIALAPPCSSNSSGVAAGRIFRKTRVAG